MAPLKTICFFTGTRAEYGLLRPVMREFQNSERYVTRLICSGSHLSNEYGLTYKEIEADGFAIDERVEILLSTDTPVGTGKAFGLGVMGITESLSRLKPDLLIVLGDRYEALAAAISASLLNLPIAHIAGGERSLGAIDEVFRHSITKLSHLHFASTEIYRARIVSMGEAQSKVFHVGSTAIDNMASYRWLSRSELEDALNFKFKGSNLLVTFHPETLSRDAPKQQFANLLTVLEQFQHCGLIFTKANADAGGREINEMIDDFVRYHTSNALAVTSLGTHRYLSLMQIVDVLVGNSSSGIIEAPSFKKPVVDVGNRQGGRVKGINVIESPNDPKAIKVALERALTPEFSVSLQFMQNPYDAGGAARKIRQIVDQTDLDRLIPKYLQD